MTSDITDTFLSLVEKYIVSGGCIPVLKPLSVDGLLSLMTYLVKGGSGVDFLYVLPSYQ